MQILSKNCPWFDWYCNKQCPHYFYTTSTKWESWCWCRNFLETNCTLYDCKFHHPKTSPANGPILNEKRPKYTNISFETTQHYYVQKWKALEVQTAVCKLQTAVCKHAGNCRIWPTTSVLSATFTYVNNRDCFLMYHNDIF